MDESDLPIWVAEEARIQKICTLVAEDSDGPELVAVVRDLLAAARQGLLEAQQRARLERRITAMALAHRDTAGNSNKKLSEAWKAGGMPQQRQRRSPFRTALDYVRLASGSRLLIDDLLDRAATAEERTHFQGTARQLIDALADPSIDRPAGLAVTDAPCTPQERCELIAAFRGLQSASSYAAHLRRARSEIARLNPGCGTVAEEFLQLLSDVPHGR